MQQRIINSSVYSRRLDFFEGQGTNAVIQTNAGSFVFTFNYPTLLQTEYDIYSSLFFKNESLIVFYPETYKFTSLTQAYEYFKNIMEHGLVYDYDRQNVQYWIQGLTKPPTVDEATQLRDSIQELRNFLAAQPIFYNLKDKWQRDITTGDLIVAAFNTAIAAYDGSDTSVFQPVYALMPQRLQIAETYLKHWYKVSDYVDIFQHKEHFLIWSFSVKYGNTATRYGYLRNGVQQFLGDDTYTLQFNWDENIVLGQDNLYDVTVYIEV